MQDLTPEQIIQIGQRYFPQIDAQTIIDIFEKVKSVVPEGTSNLEIVQLIKKHIDSKKPQTDMKNLRQLLGNR